MAAPPVATMRLELPGDRFETARLGNASLFAGSGPDNPDRTAGEAAALARVQYYLWDSDRVATYFDSRCAHPPSIQIYFGSSPRERKVSHCPTPARARHA
jgi:hypothetical protein